MSSDASAALGRREQYARAVRAYQRPTAYQRARAVARNAAVFALSIGKAIDQSHGWIRFPYYHHVFDDERDGFARQLRYLRNFGEFVGIDQAVDWWQNDERIDGRYFCVTFDDGIRNQFTNAVPILVEQDIPACFFIPSGFVGQNTVDTPALARCLSRAPVGPVEFVTWDDCRTLRVAGMTIGSHTGGHRRLADLCEEESRSELRTSKATLEGQTGGPVRHFAAPWGMPGVDYIEHRDVRIAIEEGFRSFATTRRGPNTAPTSRLAIRRDLLLARWERHHLRYFFSRS